MCVCQKMCNTVPSPPQATMQTVFQLCLTIIPMMFSLSMFGVITDSMLTKSVPSSDSGKAALLCSQWENHQKTQTCLFLTNSSWFLCAGTMLGLCFSVHSLLRTVGPTIGGFLYVNYGISSIGTLQFVVNVIVFVYLLRHHLKKTEEKKEWCHEDGLHPQSVMGDV